MSFFGLTALGMDRPLAVGADRVQHLHVFDDADWGRAWEKQRRRLLKRCATATTTAIPVEAGLPLDALPAIAETVYHGPVPAPDVALLEACVRRAVGEDERLHKASFLEAVRAARREAEAQIRRRQFADSSRKPTAEPKSEKLGPRDKYTQPLTAQQEIGWEAARAGAVVAPTGAGRKSSDETKFVSALIQQGMYYF